MLTDRPRQVRIVEVGPRDGLQNEPAPISTEAKVRFVDLLSDAGYGWIEVSSFVNPGLVPRMADAEAVFAGIRQRPGTRYVALVPNPRGLARAVEAQVRDIALFAAATETFSRANINRSIEQALDDARAVIDGAGAAGIRVRAYISVAFGCPYEGPVEVGRVRAIAERLFEMGAEEVVLGDTIGVSTPADAARTMTEMFALAPRERWGLHFHDTRGMGLANILECLDLGVASFDSSAGGLGGCPFAGPGAAGNVATEDLVYLLDGLGISHGVNLEQVLEASRSIVDEVGHPLTSKVYQAGGRLRTIRAPR